jgi:hypothetical protein
MTPRTWLLRRLAGSIPDPVSFKYSRTTGWDLTLETHLGKVYMTRACLRCKYPADTEVHTQTPLIDSSTVSTSESKSAAECKVDPQSFKVMGEYGVKPLLGSKPQYAIPKL